MIKPSSNPWKNATLIVGLLLILSLTANYLQIRHAEKEHTARILDNSRNQVKIAAGQALAKSYADRANELEGRLVKERDSAKVAQRAAKIENQAIRKTLARLRPTIAPRLDSIPDLRDFVALQDSLIVGQDSLIMSLELSCMAQVRDFEEIIRLNRAQIQEQVGISNSLQEMVTFEQGQTRKSERKKRFWRTVSVAAAGGIAFLLLKPN